MNLADVRAAAEDVQEVTGTWQKSELTHENPWRKFRGMFANNPRYENVKKKMAERREQRRLAEIANGS